MKKKIRHLLLGICLCALGSCNLIAQSLPKNYLSLLAGSEAECIALRHHFHEFPELSNREFQTGAYIADYLKKLGLEVKYPRCKNGCDWFAQRRKTGSGNCTSRRH